MVELYPAGNGRTTVRPHPVLETATKYVVMLLAGGYGWRLAGGSGDGHDAARDRACAHEVINSWELAESAEGVSGLLAALESEARELSETCWPAIRLAADGLVALWRLDAGQIRQAMEGCPIVDDA
jgi:hypothetical protein